MKKYFNMSKHLSLIMAFFVFFLFVILTISPGLWAESYLDFENELISIEKNAINSDSSELTREENKNLEEKEMMADLITDEVSEEKSSIQKNIENKSNFSSENQTIIKENSTIKKRRVRSR